MSALLDILKDACAGLPMTTRKMFGGHGFFAPNGGMFAGIVSDHEIIFKLGDETARAELIELGGRAWTYKGDTKPMTMREWIVVPENFYDDQELFAAWARRAHRMAPAKKIKTPKPPKKKAAPARPKKPAKKRARGR